MSLTILYRGSLSSCNYACEYCPFAKTKNTRQELSKDKADLQRFVAWVKQQKQEISILFTPWGEALIRGYYREAITQLSQLEQVKKVVIQTNFSCSSDWLQKVNKDTAAFWVTYHPTEISLTLFLQKCAELDEKNISYSVGIVGTKENFEYIQECREKLSKKRYLWINAYKREKNYYSQKEIQKLTEIDPLFSLNNQVYPSYKKECKTGETVISVNGEGEVTRCHFVKQVIGNLYDEEFSKCLQQRPCPNQTCDCYIGYIHLSDLGLDETYGDRILERIYY